MSWQTCTLKSDCSIPMQLRRALIVMCPHRASHHHTTGDRQRCAICHAFPYAIRVLPSGWCAASPCPIKSPKLALAGTHLRVSHSVLQCHVIR